MALHRHARTNRLSASICIVVLSMLLLAFVPPANAATGCPQKRIDPVRGMWFDCEDWGYIWCELTPLAQVGEPTSLYGHRVGVYAYTCPHEYGYHAQTSVIVADENLAPGCHYVPYLSVGGVQVPGTGETYCNGEDLRGAYDVDLDTPNAVPAAGLVVVYPCPNGGLLECWGWDAGYEFTSPWTLVATCWNSSGSMSNGLTDKASYVRVDDNWVYPLQCNAPRWT
jgi:hypothetical protein